MAKKKLKVLGVHGLGDHRGTTWKDDWTRALTRAFPGQDRIELEISFLTYDPIFERVEISPWEAMRAVWRLARGGVSSALGRRRGVVSDVSDKLKWTAGYVVAWLEDEKFKRESRRLVLDTVAATQPDLVLAHSLGSLITYDAFSHQDARKAAVAAALRRVDYVTLGSQLGNPFVMGTLADGRLVPPPVKHWYHLWNREDDVFTAPIQLSGAANFRQIDTVFDIPGIADHAAQEYLKHVNAIESVWRPIAERRLDARAFGASVSSVRDAPRGRAKEPRRRALLVGINEYPAEDDRLEGCVNDVFLMSSVLQECGFPAESIRVCLDQRATAKGITDRLRWLLDDPRPNDQLVFYYSGHGARIPEYGADFEPDHQTETLVPWDFDWTPERAVVDDQIYELYSQLPYDTRFAMILDCCHSGGLHRQGGGKVRGLAPPDDIRHRELKWDSASSMWVERDFVRLNRKFSSNEEVNQAFFGERGAVTRLGRASLLRRRSEAEYRQASRRAHGKPVGPYLPLIIEACGESQLSYEYRHGATSYGAFTYALSVVLRKHKRISFEALVKATSAQLEDLRYDQSPQILGPSSVRRARVPWSAVGEHIGPAPR